jgi:hypothetical protein
MSTAAVKTSKASAPSWTCARCEVTIRYMPGHERRRPPSGWGKHRGAIHCLACRRDLAAEAALAKAGADTTREDRAKLRASARVDFEILRDPERPNGEIAKALRCSVPAVMRARQRLEAAAKRDG